MNSKNFNFQFSTLNFPRHLYLFKKQHFLYFIRLFSFSITTFASILNFLLNKHHRFIMAKFAQYYLKYLKDDMFAETVWAQRQKHLGSLLQTDKSIEFTLGNEQTCKTYKHNVRHLSLNNDIIVMQIANEKTKEVVQNFRTVDVLHEPPCFVIIDNRANCRRIAIQKKKESFSSTDSLKKILQQVLDRNMRQNFHIGIELHPQYYPRDFYKAWNMRQFNTAKIRFNISDGKLPETFSGEDLEDQRIMDFAIKLNEEESRKKYRSVLELNPPEDKAFIEVDKSSVFIRNLVKFQANTGGSIEIITTDGARFTCFIDNCEEGDSIITNEFDTAHLNVIFGKYNTTNEEEAQKALITAENELLKFVNNMKTENDEKKDEKEGAA